jgi:hypothetical protein
MQTFSKPKNLIHKILKTYPKAMPQTYPKAMQKTYPEAMQKPAQKQCKKPTPKPTQIQNSLKIQLPKMNLQISQI